MNNYRKRVSPLKNSNTIDYKNIDLLKKFITDQGKILPRRSTGLTSKQQKQAVKAIKRARILSYLPFISKDGVKLN
uniref:ribosomal protein S18 n=1 Tax=Madagascaria erythrocladioides TaxID=753684 RepID=UPI001BF0BDEF|nr:ribosomal protein S18 [Madagascaria erythrocladioides]QUE29089.1 ribosomal protein S18 [Madagascaria erythrocladioides]UNJ16645.1 ribosomal protein S18 [Madagascaria erythrocladioides]